MKKVKVGVIGCGYMAQMAHIPCLAANPEAELVALCDCRKTVAQELCRRYGIPHAAANEEELLAMDLDAVYILTPAQHHLAGISAALAAGMAVFTEKPAAMSEASIRKLASAGGRGVTVGYMKRYERNIAEFREIRRNSAWGKLLFVRAHSFVGSEWNALVHALSPVVSSSEAAPELDVSQLDPGPEWLWEPRDGKFYSFDNPYYALLDTGCHSVNLLRYLAGDAAVTGVRNANGVKIVDFDFNGAPGTMEFCINFNMHRFDEVTELYYEKASVRIMTPAPLDRQSSATVEIYSEDGGLHRRLLLDETRQWAFAAETDAFLRRVLDNDTASADLEEAACDVKIIENIYKKEKGAK